MVWPCGLVDTVGLMTIKEEVKEVRAQTIIKIIYVDIKLTKNFYRNGVRGSDSEPGAKIFKE